MKIAILGATSQIAKDLVQSFSKNNDHDLVLFARRPEVVSAWLYANGMADRYETSGFANFTPNRSFDAVINFVGVGSPAQAAAMGSSILDITHEYDERALRYISANPRCKYIFLSSGAAYGSNFEQPVNFEKKANFAVNSLGKSDWYGIAKLYAETRHRAHSDLLITDVRIFSYFSKSLDINSRFFVTDVLQAIKENRVFETDDENIYRDYLTPLDFYNLINLVLNSRGSNVAIDAYSRAPIAKFDLLNEMSNSLGLNYKTVGLISKINATGNKLNYYSLNKLAFDIYGYEPEFTSLDGVVSESIVLLKRLSFDQ